MPIVPAAELPAVQFYETHDPIWNTNAVAIGLTVAAVTAQTSLTSKARDAYSAQQTAKVAAKNATQAFHDAVKKMRGNGSDLIATIKAFAQTTADPTVYTKAQIPPASAPTPAPAPGQPTNITVSLESSGAITLKWKAVNAAPNAGTFFSVQRKLAAERVFSLVGNTGGKSFTDVTLSQGTPGASYIIQGHRGVLDGEASEQVSVQFGVGGDGIVGISAVGGATVGVKMAA